MTMQLTSFFPIGLAIGDAPKNVLLLLSNNHLHLLLFFSSPNFHILMDFGFDLFKPLNSIKKLNVSMEELYPHP